MVKTKKYLLAVVCCILTTTSAARAWAQEKMSQPTMGSRDVPAAPDALPGDAHPPSVEIQLQVPLGPPAGTPAPKKEIAKPSLTFELALEAANAALESCAKDGYPLAVAVTDPAGTMIVGFSPDGVAAGRVYMAVRKSLAAMAFKAPTSTLRVKFAADPSLKTQLKPNMAILPGALPVLVGDRVVGAIATSGATGNEEEKCAGDGAKKIQARLK
jgi:uncharacterized protein GlcG (DUF336 family)